jgi:hypothetical protein
MSKKMIALAGPLTLLVGLLWMLSSVGEFVLMARLGSPDSFWDAFWLVPILLGLIPQLLALTGTWLRFRDAGALSRLGLGLAVAGCAGLIAFLLAGLALSSIAPQLGHEWARLIEGATMLSVMLGYGLFGIDAVRLKLLPRWNAAPLLAAAAVVFRLLPDALNLPNYDPAQLGMYFLNLSLTGLSWVLLGLAMLEPIRIRHAATA